MTFKELAQDLFIPIRRRQRPSSVESDRSAISTSPTTFSTPSPTPSQRPINFNSSATPTKTSTSIPSSGVQYTIHDSTKTSSPFGFRPKSSSPLKLESSEQSSNVLKTNKAATTKQNVKHSRNFSSPVSLLYRKVSPSKPVLTPNAFHHSVDLESLEFLMAEEQDIRTTIPTPFPSPDSQHDPTRADDVPLAYQSTLPADHDTLNFVRTGRSTEPGINRPRSRDSSLSSGQRAHPPSSFPTNLPGPLPTQRDVWSSTSRRQQDRSNTPNSQRHKKRYTILGIPSEATDANNTPMRRRNSSGQYTDTSIPSGSQVAIQRPPESAHNQDLGVQRRQHTQTSSQTPFRTASHHSRSASSQYRPNNDYSFHTVLHHYAACSHTSPPSSRPLNEQPYLESYASTSTSRPETVRSVIRGSCFDCDTASRRDEETQILLRFSPEISRMTNELTYLVEMLEETNRSQLPTTSPPRTPLGRKLGSFDAMSPEQASTMTGRTTGSGSTVNTAQTNVFTDATSTTSMSSQETADSLGRQISQLQIIIFQLSTRRDSEVNAVWSGYSARWGPGTLGVVQTKQAESISSRSVSRVGSNSRPRSTIENQHIVPPAESSYASRGNASEFLSAQHSPQKTTFAEDPLYEHDRHYQSQTTQPRKSSTPSADIFFTPAGTRSRSVRTSLEIPSRSVYSSFVDHQRAQSRDSTPNTPFGARSVARTETGISYSNSDTPVGRMKVNWVRGPDQN